MPRVKTTQEFYGLHLAIASELEKYVEKRGYIDVLHRDMMLLLLRVARQPEILTCYQSRADDIKSFGSIYFRYPDLVLDILSFIRKTLAEWQKNQAGFIRIFLRTHATALNANGQRAPIVSMTDGELAHNLTRAAGFEITPASVKRERQRIAKVDRSPLGFLEHPEVQQYYRDGKMTPELRRLLNSLQKGKK